MALLPAVAPAPGRWYGSVVQRSVHALVSLQYHRTSSHALPPSGSIWYWDSRVPHSQHETTSGASARSSA